jgi:hypothetical protein
LFGEVMGVGETGALSTRGNISDVTPRLFFGDYEPVGLGIVP